MATPTDLVRQVDSFLTNSDNTSVKDIPTDSQIIEISGREAASVDRRVNINQYGHTSELNSKFVLPHVETTAHWLRRAKEHESALENTIESMGTSHLSDEIDRLEKQSTHEVEKLKERHRNGHWGALAKEKDETEHVYNTMVQANDGKPPRKLPIWYWFILLIIGSGEWLINYDTFAAKFAVQAMAIGMTLLVAFSFAAASHFHGEFLKQRVFLMGKQVSLPARRTHLTFQFVSLVLFIASFAAVILVRYQVVQDELSLGAGTMALPGESVAAQQSALELVLPTIFLNLVVYLLGAVISYALHDSIPGYQGAKNDREKARSDFEKQDNVLHKEREEIEDKFHTDIQAQRSKIKAIEEQAKSHKQMLRKLRAAMTTTKKRSIRRLNSLVDNYRVQFATALRDVDKGEVVVGPQELSLDNYLQKEIHVSEEIFDEYV